MHAHGPKHRPHVGGITPYGWYLGLALSLIALEYGLGWLLFRSLILFSDVVGHAPLHIIAVSLVVWVHLTRNGRSHDQHAHLGTWTRRAIAVLILAGNAHVFHEATERLSTPEVLSVGPALVVACVGLFINRLQIYFLQGCNCDPDAALTADAQSDVIASYLAIAALGAIAFGAPPIVECYATFVANVWIAKLGVWLFLGWHDH